MASIDELLAHGQAVVDQVAHNPVVDALGENLPGTGALADAGRELVGEVQVSQIVPPVVLSEPFVAWLSHGTAFPETMAAPSGLVGRAGEAISRAQDQVTRGLADISDGVSGLFRVLQTRVLPAARGDEALADVFGVSDRAEAVSLAVQDAVAQINQLVTGAEDAGGHTVGDVSEDPSPSAADGEGTVSAVGGETAAPAGGLSDVVPGALSTAAMPASFLTGGGVSAVPSSPLAGFATPMTAGTPLAGGGMVAPGGVTGGYPTMPQAASSTPHAAPSAGSRGGGVTPAEVQKMVDDARRKIAAKRAAQGGASAPSKSSFSPSRASTATTAQSPSTPLSQGSSTTAPAETAPSPGRTVSAPQAASSTTPASTAPTAGSSAGGSSRAGGGMMPMGMMGSGMRGLSGAGSPSGGGSGTSNSFTGAGGKRITSTSKTATKVWNNAHTTPAGLVRPDAVPTGDEDPGVTDKGRGRWQ